MSLNGMRRVFIEEYLRCWNQTKAARRAGYKNPEVMGCRLMKVKEIRELIDQRIERLAMSANEVLLRLGEQARSEQTIYLTENGEIDLSGLIADDKAHLVKGTHWDRSGKLVIEFYSAQLALIQLGKHHGLFKDRIEHSGPEGNPIVATNTIIVREYVKSNGSE